MEEIDELNDLLNKNKIIRSNMKEEYIIDDEVNNNINIFGTWMKQKYRSSNIYNKFVLMFDNKYRSDLFKNIYDHLENDTLITNDILFYWKLIIIDLIKCDKKYSYFMKYLQIDYQKKESNLYLSKNKYVFRCSLYFNGNYELICQFKDNSNDYYIN